MLSDQDYEISIALLYLRSDSTIVPLADAKLSGKRDAFEKSLLNNIFFEVIEKKYSVSFATFL